MLDIWMKLRETEKVLFNKEIIGTMNYVNGDVYKGDWVNDERTGNGWFMLIKTIGVCNYIRGEVYYGEWNHDKFNGQGFPII